jgi:hypothetical protein
MEETKERVDTTLSLLTIRKLTDMKNDEDLMSI